MAAAQPNAQVPVLQSDNWIDARPVRRIEDDTAPRYRVEIFGDHDIPEWVQVDIANKANYDDAKVVAKRMSHLGYPTRIYDAENDVIKERFPAAENEEGARYWNAWSR